MELIAIALGVFVILIIGIIYFVDKAAKKEMEKEMLLVAEKSVEKAQEISRNLKEKHKKIREKYNNLRANSSTH